MGAFAGLKDAKRGFNSNPVQEGKYVARIDASNYFDTEQNGEMWKNTLTILAVVDGDAHRVGEVVHTFFRTKAGKKVFQQNLKSFIAGVLDVADEAIGEPEADEVLSENNPMLGLVTTLTVRRQASKTAKDEKTGEPLTYLVYSWAPSLSNDEIKSAIGAEGVARFFPSGL